MKERIGEDDESKQNQACPEYDRRASAENDAEINSLARVVQGHKGLSELER